MLYEALLPLLWQPGFRVPGEYLSPQSPELWRKASLSPRWSDNLLCVSLSQEFSPLQLHVCP